MVEQSEQVLEEQLAVQLQKLGYGLTIIKDQRVNIANLKQQLEKHNNITFTKTEFDRVLYILSIEQRFSACLTNHKKSVPFSAL